MKIIITDGSYKHSLGILVSLRKLGYEVDFIGDKKSICNFANGLGSLVLLEESFYEQSAESLANFFSSKNYDLILPIGAKSVRKISECCKEPYIASRCIVPSLELFVIACNKYKMSKIACQLGFDVPKSILLNSLDNLEELNELTGEIVIKGVGEEIKVGPHYFFDQQAAKQFLRRCNFEDSLIAQQRVAGTGVGYFGFYVGGECLIDYAHKRVREYPISGGVSCAAELFDNEKIFEFGRSILKYLQWNGVAMVEFKYDESEEKIWFIEVNPKFWGSHDLALSANINIPLTIMQRIGDNLHLEDESRLDQLRYTWPLDGDLNSMFSSRDRFYSTLSDLINPSVKSNLYWDQPKLFTRQILQFFKNHLVTNSHVKSVRNLIARIRKIGIYFTLVRSVTEKIGIPFSRYSNIENEIWIGPQHSKLGMYYLSTRGVNACLSLRASTDDAEHGLALLNYLNIPVIEYHAPSKLQLIDGARFIKSQIDLDHKVYVHCREGVSRAVVFVVAYLILYKGHNTNSAIEFIKKRRPFINILENQKDALLLLDKRDIKHENNS